AQAARLAALAERQRLPSIGFREFADLGGLLGFGVDFPDVWKRAAGFVDRIFKGAKPADIPMQQPEKFDTVVNLRTAKALQLTIPRRVLPRADKIIEWGARLVVDALAREATSPPPTLDAEFLTRPKRRGTIAAFSSHHVGAEARREESRGG